MFRPLVRSVMVAVGIAVVAVLAAVPAAQSAFAENRVALVIGQSAYRAVLPLPNPANDARAMTQMLGEAGFDVMSAADLPQNELRKVVGDFAAKIAAKGPDVVALVYYAGHGLQMDGENYLLPVDIDPKREADVALQAVRLNDVLNTLEAVPSSSRIILLDACRNNPFPDINKTAGHGLALVDTKVGVVGTLLAFSTSPGAEAEDGAGANSPYTGALLKVGRERGLSIEDTFKRVRLSVNQATDGRQTPWESSSLVRDFRLFGPADAVAKPVAKRTLDERRRELQGKSVEAANELTISDGSVDAYEAFVGLYAQTPSGLQARDWLDRNRRMAAWNKAVIGNTAAGYRSFLSQYPDSDLTATARRLEDRLRNRPAPAGTVAIAAPAMASSTPTANAPTATAALAGPTCPCAPPAGAPDPASKKRAESPAPKRTADRPRRGRDVSDDDDVVVTRRPRPVSSPSSGGGGYGRSGY